MTVSLQLTLKKLEYLRRELKKNNVPVESLRKAAMAKTHCGKDQVSRLGEMTKRRQYAIYVQKPCYGFALVVHDRLLKYVKLETSKLCFGYDSLAQSCKSRARVVGESGKRILLEVREKVVVLHCSVQLALDMRPYAPSWEQGSDACLRYVVKTEMLEERRE